MNLDDLFSRFVNAETILGDEFQIGIVDSPWFKQYAGSREVKMRAASLRERSRGRFHPKTDATAMHDALMINWIKHERERTGRKTWLLTLDSLLPTELVSGESTSYHASSAVTLDTVLQWLAPVSSANVSDDEAFATLFSEAVSNMLLPQDNLFDLQDVSLFSQMELDCRALPPEDVEGCLRMIRTQLPSLNPTVARDRERLSYEIQKYFSAGGRKYKEQLTAKDEDLLQVTREIEALRAEKAGAELRASAYVRLTWCIALLIVMMVAFVACALRFERGDNDYLKIRSSLPFLALVLSVRGILSCFIFATKERAVALGWPFKRLLKPDS